MATTSPLRIGIDFDNTIVSYDELFRSVAIEQRLVPESVPASKTEVRNYLRNAGKEDAWTAMQGLVYGKRMPEAKAFPGVIDFIRACYRAEIPVFIASHRTKFPIVGESVDLHASALDWLRLQGIPDFIPAERIYFELTKEAKLEQIRHHAFTHFIDDLPEFLTMPAFALSTQRILFNPQDAPVAPLAPKCQYQMWSNLPT